MRSEVAGSRPQSRLYRKYLSLRRALDRTALGFAHYYPWAVPVACITLAVNTLWVPVGIWLYLQGLPWLSATLYAVTVAAWMPWYRSKVWGLFAPYAVYIVPLVILPSLVKGLPGMRTEWKGRKV